MFEQISETLQSHVLRFFANWKKEEVQHKYWFFWCLTFFQLVPAILCTLVHVTIRVVTLSIWCGASHMWYMSKDFLGFIHSVSKGNIVGNLWFGYNCQFHTQKTQNWENLVILGLFKWHKFTSYPSHSARYCVYWSKITNLGWKIIKYQ